MGKGQQERKAQQEMQDKAQLLLKDFETFQKSNIEKYQMVLVPAMDIKASGIIAKFSVENWIEPVAPGKIENEDIPV